MYAALSFPSILFIVFLVLKLCDVIAWSWFFITMPLWIIPASVAVVILAVVAFAKVFTCTSGHKKH